MKRIGFGALLILAVAACNHRQPEPAPAPSSEEAALTGVPEYPRAYPVALPVTVATTPPAPAAAPLAAATVASASPPAVMAPSEVASSPAIPAAPATPETPAISSEVTSPTPPAMDTTTMTSPPDAGAEASPSPAAPGPVPSPAVPSPAAADQVVVLDTSFGLIVIELDDFAAPKTCANFRQLVGAGFYDGTIFHRVIPNFIIQGGDPNTKGPNRATYGLGDPGYTLPPEIKLHHDQGAVAMARLPDAVNPQRYSNGSQFYICVAACPSLDDQYTVFGHVIAGLDVANRIATAPADRRNDPLERINFKATLEPRDRALRESGTTGP